MLYHDFIKCLTTGTWQLRGHSYHFLSPALQKHGYFIVDGISDTQLTFEVSYENGLLYLYLNVDQEAIPGERYRVLDNYCEASLCMVHEVLNANESGYEDPTEVVFEKILVPAPQVNHGIFYKIGAKLNQLFKKSGGLEVAEG